MRTISLICFLLLGTPIFAQTQPVVPATRIVPADAPALKPREPGKLPEAAQPIYFSALRATEWLKLTNKPDGRFVYGFQPALRVQLDGDNFQSQAGATLALARASRYFRDGASSAKASETKNTGVSLGCHNIAALAAIMTPSAVTIRA